MEITPTKLPELSRSEALRIFGSIDKDNVLLYVEIRNNCCVSHRQEVILEDAISIWPMQLHTRTFDEVRKSAILGNVKDCLEAGLRTWSGCGTKMASKGAMDWWEYIIDASKKPGMNVSRRVYVRALACLANAHWEQYHCRGLGQIDRIYMAGLLANACISYGFIPPVVMGIANEIGKHLSTETIAGVDYSRFDKLTHLRDVVFKEEKQDSLQDIMANRCAAPGCGVESSEKTTLLRCAGKCPMEVKPAYCCKDCQRSHWKEHRTICKAAVQHANNPNILERASQRDINEGTNE